MKKTPFRRVVLEALKKIGPCGTNELLGAIGNLVTASQADRAYKRHQRAWHKSRGVPTAERKRDADKSGKKHVLSDCLNGLVASGLAERLGRGIYRAK